MKKLYTELNKNIDNFYCYSINLYRYLKNNGIRYEEKYKTKENKTCWVYKRTESFEVCYKNFSLLKTQWKNNVN